MKPTIEEKAFGFIERLLQHGSWFHSAIEFYDADGEQLEDEANAILDEAEASGKWQAQQPKLGEE